MKYRAFADGLFFGPTFDTKNAAAQFLAATHKFLDFSADEEEPNTRHGDPRSWEVSDNRSDEMAHPAAM